MEEGHTYEYRDAQVVRGKRQRRAVGAESGHAGSIVNVLQHTSMGDRVRVQDEDAVLQALRRDASAGGRGGYSRMDEVSRVPGSVGRGAVNAGGPRGAVVLSRRDGMYVPTKPSTQHAWDLILECVRHQLEDGLASDVVLNAADIVVEVLRTQGDGMSAVEKRRQIEALINPDG